MTLTTIFYLVAIAVCLVMIYSNAKRSMEYRRDNMEVLYTLDKDGKGMRTLARVFLLFMVLASAASLYDGIYRYGLMSFETLQFVMLPVLFIVLYIPLSRKTKITNLGINRNGNLIRWSDIKGIDYLRPDSKGRVKARILYKTSYKDMVQEIVFEKDDAQIEKFKLTAKEWRNKKKEKNVKK